MSDSGRPASGLSDNPFAPAAEPGTFRPAGAAGPLRKLDLDAARRALRAHVNDPNKLASDRSERGARFRIAPIVAAAIGGLGMVGGAVAATSGGDDGVVVGAVAGVVAFVVALFGTIFLVMDARLGDRDAPQDCDKAALTYWRAIAGRPPYAWTILAPTGRLMPVSVPELHPVVVTPGTHEVSSPATFKAWTAGFIRGGGGQQRQLRVVVNPVVTKLEGDYAETETQVEFSSIPQWFMAIAAVAFVLIRLIGVVLLLVAQFALRQKQIVTVRQRWLRGDNATWYLLDADVAV